MSAIHWVPFNEHQLALVDPCEVAATFYIGIEQFYHVDPDRAFVNSDPVSVELSKVIELAQPGILEDPETGSQLRPLQDLRLVRATVEVTNHWYPGGEAQTAKLAREVMLGDIGSTESLPRIDSDPPLDGLPASVFAVTVYFDALVAAHPDLQSSFRPYNYVRAAADVNATLLEAALEDAFAFASFWAERSYRLMRNTVQVFTPKILDTRIPYVLSMPHIDSRLAHGEVDNSHRVKVVATETAARMSNSVEHFSDSEDLGPIEGFISAIQEAESAFNRGLYRSAAIMSAAASEHSINTLLQLLRWEDGVEPDKSAEDWEVREGIQARVKNKFASHLGGNWDLTTDGVLKNWAESVAELRNYIAHAGHTPTSKEAQSSIQCAYELQVELSDRVMTERNIGRYTRTAFLLAGNEGLERRKRRTRRVRELQNSKTEPVWIQSSKAWIAQHGHCLRAMRFGWGEAAPSDRDVLLVVRSSDHYISLVEFAKTRGWAREITNPSLVLSHYPKSSLQDLVRRAPVDSSEEYVIIHLMHRQTIPDTCVGPKLPAFRLVPLEQISPRWLFRAEATFQELLEEHFQANK